jgi:sugar lactone lactonase YvrE
MIFCACCLFIAQARPADYTLYSPVTFSTITAFNTSTWQPSKTIPAVNSGNFVLSADGNTFYASVSSENRVVAIDRTSGSVLHVYTLTYPLAAGLAILPNQSQLYVGTCASYLGSVGCVGGEVEVFDVTSEHHLAILSMGSDQITQIVAAPNGAAVYVTHFYAPDQYGGDVRPAAVTPDQASVPSETLTAIDVATLQVGASAGVFQMAPMSVAISQDSSSAFLLAAQDLIWGPSVYAVDLADMTITATLPIGMCVNLFGGVNIALSPDGSTLATASNCPSGYANALEFIDTATLSVTQTVANFAGGVIALDSSNNAYVSEGSTVYVDSQTGAVTTLINGRSGTSAFSPDAAQLYILFGSGGAVLSEGAPSSPHLLNIANAPMWMAVSPNGQTLYSSGYTGGIVAVDTQTGQVTGQMLQTSNWLGAIAVSADGATLYVIEIEGYRQPYQLQVLDASSGTIVNSIALPICEGTNPGEAIAITPDGGEVYAMECGVTTVYDTKTMNSLGTISGAAGAAVAANPKGKAVYVSTGGNVIDVIDPATVAITATIPISANAIVFSPDGGTAYVESTQNSVNGVAVVDTASLAVTGFVPGINPLPIWGQSGDTGTGGGEALAITPDGKYLYAAGTPGSVIDTQTLQIVGQFDSNGPIVVH